MVQINPNDPTKLEFNKLNDPEDSQLLKIYKHCFRYASPNLFIWGPLAPAHDALYVRDLLAKAQIFIGCTILYGSFRRFPSTIGSFRRRITRVSSFLAGTVLCATAIREIAYYWNPNSNPLYIEMNLARELSILDKSNNGVSNKGSYWFGPKNFMPMNNEQYWKMVYSLEVNEIMFDQYIGCSIIQKYNQLLHNFKPLKEQETSLTETIENVINEEDQQITDLNDNSLNLPEKMFPAFSKDVSDSKSKTLLSWSKHNPFDTLQLQEYREFYSYEFPRFRPSEK